MFCCAIASASLCSSMDVLMLRFSERADAGRLPPHLADRTPPPRLHPRSASTSPKQRSSFSTRRRADAFCRNSPPISSRGPKPSRHRVIARAITRCREGFGPREEIGGLFRQKASALLLVEKDDRCFGEVLALRGCNRGGGVLSAKCGGSRPASARSLNLSIKTSIEEHKEAEAIAQQNIALPLPGVRGLARRVVEPVAGEGKVFSQGRKGGVSRIEIAIEAEMLLRFRLRCLS